MRLTNGVASRNTFYGSHHIAFWTWPCPSPTLSGEGVHETIERHGVDQFASAREYRARYVLRALRELGKG